MQVIPAIDLIDGHCVRLTEGRFDTAVVYGDDPLQTAGSFAEAGASRLHVVDLDAARGTGNNRGVIRRLRNVFPGTLEVGGGIRDIEIARELLDVGVDRLVVGTVLAREPQTVENWIRELGPVLVGGIDAREGEVKTAGWEEGSSITATALAAQAANIGVVELIYTDIARDGTLRGPDVDGALAVASASGLPVIISGGIGGPDDLMELKKSAAMDAKLSGVIIGKAIYEGKIELAQAISTLEGGTAL